MVCTRGGYAKGAPERETRSDRVFFDATRLRDFDQVPVKRRWRL